MTSERVFGAAIFRPDFDLTGPHLIAASAGTGKTYNIQNIYVRLVGELGLRVSQIQVMTFTEAATKELRDRIRRVLSGMSRVLAGDVADLNADELARLGKLRTCAQANLPGGADAADRILRGRIELGLMEFDQAAISTIHGFCRRALARFAFETGSPFAGECEDTMSEDLSRRVRDWWRKDRLALPEDARKQLDLATLDAFVRALAGKSDWSVDAPAAGASAGDPLVVAKTIVEAYEADRARREKQTFDDLLRALRDALADREKGPELSALLRAEFKAALVDEFQDTDPVQYDIFRRLFLGADAHGGALYFVGDPKQAIYSFRGGDIYTYKRAVQSAEVAPHAFCLDRNFRSTPRLIDAVNALFRDVRRPDGACSRTFGDDAIAYADDLRSTPLPALKTADGRDDAAPFRIVRVANRSARVPAVVADAVLEVLAEQPHLTPRDIAILVPSHRAGADYRAELRARGVPVVMQKAGNVFAGETAMAFYDVLQAMALRGGAGQVRAALLSPFFSFAAKDLAGGNETLLADMIGTFGELNRIWNGRGFNAAMAALEACPACDFRRRFAGLPDGERRLADILQIVELANKAILRFGPAPDVLVDWLTARINLSGESRAEVDAEEYARQLESEDDAVKIMTVHVSKGLEFPVAIIPLAAKGKSASPPYFHHDAPGRLRVSADEAAQAAAQKELDDEQMRLLYVAMTRASRRTVVIAPAASFGNPAFARLVDNARIHGAGEDAADSPIRWSDYAEVPRPDYRPPRRDTASLKAAATPRPYSRDVLRGSYSTLAPAFRGTEDDAHDFDAAAEVPPVETETHPVFGFMAGRQVGIAWHEIFEAIPFDADPDAIRKQTEASLRVNGVLAGGPEARARQVAAVADMVRAALDWPLTSPAGRRFALRDVGAADRFSEWEFDFSSAAAVDRTAELARILEQEWAGDGTKAAFLSCLRGWNRPIPKGWFRGFLDLVFRKDGYYYVADWKSNVLDRTAESFAAENVTAEMARAGYFWQYLLYAVVLRRLLVDTMGDAYSWARHFGGVRYYFLRGVAAGRAASVFADRPGESLLKRLSAALGLERA
ncbi:MAG: UvrD-helicase domain-containing protein [Kiritimatiellia bacterium]